MRRRILYSVVLLVIAAALVGAMKYGVGGVTAPVPIPVPRDVAVVCAAGKVEPVTEEIKISAEIAGVLKDVPVEEGQRLRKGQKIATLENAEFSARVAAAEATVKGRQASIERLVNGSREQERREAGAAVDEAQAVLVEARTEMVRKQALFEARVASRSERERAEREFHVADARLAEAREHFSFVDAPPRADELARAQADLDLAWAQLAEARALLDKTVVRAPFDGTILKRFRRAGEAVSDKADTPIVSFGDNSRLRVRVDVDETDIAKVRIGARAYFKAQAFGEEKFWGRVVRIGQQLGKKNIDTEQPTEKADTKVLETLVELDGRPPLPTGLRVDSYLIVHE